MNWNGCKFGNQEVPKGTNALNKNTSALKKINYLSIDLMSDLLKLCFNIYTKMYVLCKSILNY